MPVYQSMSSIGRCSQHRFKVQCVFIFPEGQNDEMNDDKTYVCHTGVKGLLS